MKQFVKHNWLDNDVCYQCGETKNEINIDITCNIDITSIEIKATIPHNNISGVASRNKILHAKRSICTKLNKFNVYAIEMIDSNFRTRTTRSKNRFENLLYNKKLKINDYIICKNNLDNQHNYNILCKVTDIYDDTNPKFLNNWFKEGWSECGKKYLHDFKKGAGCIEFVKIYKF